MTRRTKNLPAIQDRREQVIRLRGQGYTWREIADRTGYSDASAALKAFKAAAREAPSLAMDEIRTQERERLDILFAATAEQIRNPGPRVSAIGKVALYPEGHERAGQIVEDESVRARAIDNYRKVSESLRRLHGADQAPPPGTYVDNRIQVKIDQINQDRAGVGLPPLRLPEPTGATIPEDQARAQCEADLARRRNPGGGIFVPPSVIAKGEHAVYAYVTTQQWRTQHTAAITPPDTATDDDVTEAEIIED